MRRDSGGLANEAYLSNPIVSSKQWLSSLKTTNCINPMFVYNAKILWLKFLSYSFLEIMDDIILESLGKEVLKFQSVKAYKFFNDAKYSQKSWQTLQILLIGVTLEVIKQFKQDSLEQDPLIKYDLLQIIPGKERDDLLYTHDVGD